jgi:hypothetical protein
MKLAWLEQKMSPHPFAGADAGVVVGVPVLAGAGAEV